MVWSKIWQWLPIAVAVGSVVVTAVVENWDDVVTVTKTENVRLYNHLYD